MPHLPNLDRRLQRRYENLVMGHAAPLQDVAAGTRVVPNGAETFAATQAAWRFYAKEETTPAVLAAPLLQASAAGLATSNDSVALVVCDWSQLHFRKHTSKLDRVALTNHHDLGYELLTALLLSDRDGEPIGPVFASLRCAAGIYTSNCSTAKPKEGTKLDRLDDTFSAVEKQKWSKPAVYIIDREADSVGHYRQWHQSDRRFLVRADDSRVVKYGGQDVLLPQVRQSLREAGSFRLSREVEYHGQKATQYVAEAEVILERPAKSEHGTVSTPGEPLALRLVIAEVRNTAGEVLAHWMLFSNVCAETDAATLALWYYWRWRVESYFKLLKSAGQEAEHWQQETGLAVFKRLLVASMACVLAWKVARSTRPEAAKLRKTLVRLSGRQMKHKVESTEPALLAGLWVVFQSLAVLEMFDADELRGMVRGILLDPETTPTPPPNY